MKFKLDECIPSDVDRHMIKNGHDVCTVHDESLTGASDLKVWNAAQAEARFLITTDLDFSDMRCYKPGTHHGILLIRLSKEGQTTLAKFIEWLFDNYDPKSWKASLVVATDHKLRIRKSGDLG